MICLWLTNVFIKSHLLSPSTRAFSVLAALSLLSADKSQVDSRIDINVDDGATARSAPSIRGVAAGTMERAYFVEALGEKLSTDISPQDI